MKLIQILALVGATAIAAAAQNTSSTSHNAGASSQSGSAAKPGVKLIVPKARTQSGAAAQKTNPGGTTSATKPAVAQKTPVLTVKPAPKPVVKAKPAVAAAKKPVKKAPGTSKPTELVVVPQKATKDTKSANSREEETITASGRRDPFLSIIRATPQSASGSNCSVGKRCLFIPDLELKGIAKDTDGQMMAVVVSNARRAYFLRENDQVFNGSVQKITSDSVVFREFAVDHLGRETAHEVVKKLPKS